MRTPDQDFPYTSKLICYINVNSDGTVEQIGKDITKVEAYMKASNNQSQIIAVWPGRYRSDAFLIDKKQFAENLIYN